MVGTAWGACSASNRHYQAELLKNYVEIELAMISAFFVWWFGQLASVLPAWLRQSALTDDALVIVPSAPLEDIGTVAVELHRNGKAAMLGRYALGAADLKELPLSFNRPVVLRLTAADVLQKTLVLPLAAQTELDQVLAFEMDRETPFKPEELYWNHRIETVDRQRGRLLVRLLLLPKLALAPLLSALAQVGIAPRWAEILDDREQGLYLPLDSDGAHPQHRLGYLVWPTAACCVLLAVASAVTPFMRQAVELAALDRAIAVGRSTAAQAEHLRGEIDRLSASAKLINGELAKAGRPLEILAAVTEALPDDTYLTEINLRRQKVTFSGRSAGAARLIGALAANGKFHDPAFAAPVTRIEAQRMELFTINAEVP
jgi:general secretion pathway protein L